MSVYDSIDNGQEIGCSHGSQRSQRGGLWARSREVDLDQMPKPSIDVNLKVDSGN